jgi:ferrous iron transport protein B
VLAKEVVIGTLNTLYAQVGHVALLSNAGFDFWGSMHTALLSIPQNLAALPDALSNPIAASAPMHSLSQSVYGVMAQHFNGKVGAIAYLLFVLLYFPCISTTAAMTKELNQRWTYFSVLWTTGLAYAVAVLFYQLATFAAHPLSSLLWVAGIVTAAVLIFSFLMPKYQQGVMA